jgi:hypothetical protein
LLETPTMILSRLACAVAALLLAAAPLLAQGKGYTIKVTDTAAPKELAEPIRKLMSNKAVQLLDGRGAVVAEVWFRQGLPVKATDAQVKNGLTYREVPLSTVLGALRVPKQTRDYRKQKIPAGVYTLRLAVQPQDGDHMGTAPYGEFVLVCPAADDKKPDLMEAKALHELSAKTTESHPAVLLLWPGKGAGATPKLEKKSDDHWVVLVNLEVTVNGKKATLPLGLVLVGASASA